MSQDEKPLRPLGDILLDLEILLFELVDHGLQWGDVIFLVYAWLMGHAPGARETYNDDGSHPELLYGPKRFVLKWHNAWKKRLLSK